MSDYSEDEFVLPRCSEDEDEEQMAGCSNPHVPTVEDYERLYEASLRDPSSFWLRIARDHLHFDKFSGQGLEWNFDVREGPVFTRFLAGSRTNMAYNCLERVIAMGHGSRIAYHWVGNDPRDEVSLTYEQLLREVIRFSAVLRSKGVRKGDTVAIYLPMILEVPVAMLACARIGAPHTVVFAGFSSQSLAERLVVSNAKVLVTCDGFTRGSKVIGCKKLADAALAICAKQGHRVREMIVVEHLERVHLPANQIAPTVDWNPRVDSKWADEMQKFEDLTESPVEWTDAEDRLFVLFTSGSTGVPKGIVHTTAGYMTYAYATMKYVFGLREDDVYWCTADAGWITGHTYMVYGPLLNGVTSILFEGIPTYPAADRTWRVVEKYGVTKLYTSPTATRLMMSYPDTFVTSHDLSSLRAIGSVGEPLNPKAFEWLFEVVGRRRCPVLDTYWQTETGGHVIAPLMSATPLKAGSATRPFFGVEAVLVDNEGREIEGPGEGNLCLRGAFPGISRTILDDHERFEKTYYAPFPGYYFTGDGARRDADGYFWITGRVDDLMNVSGHLLSTAEIESVLCLHPDVVEAAVVACEHPVKGHTPYAFVVMKKDKQQFTPLLHDQLKAIVRERIGAIATPERIQSAPGLPKTRSGKITRRILRKIADGDISNLGDTSTLVDASIIDVLWSSRHVIRSG